MLIKLLYVQLNYPILHLRILWKFLSFLLKFFISVSAKFSNVFRKSTHTHHVYLLCVLEIHFSIKVLILWKIINRSERFDPILDIFFLALSTPFSDKLPKSIASDRKLCWCTFWNSILKNKTTKKKSVFIRWDETFN